MACRLFGAKAIIWTNDDLSYLALKPEYEVNTVADDVLSAYFARSSATMALIM